MMIYPNILNLEMETHSEISHLPIEILTEIALKIMMQIP